jgi:hypothetical protein
MASVAVAERREHQFCKRGKGGRAVTNARAETTSQLALRRHLRFAVYQLTGRAWRCEPTLIVVGEPKQALFHKRVSVGGNFLQPFHAPSNELVLVHHHAPSFARAWPLTCVPDCAVCHIAGDLFRGCTASTASHRAQADPLEIEAQARRRRASSTRPHAPPSPAAGLAPRHTSTASARSPGQGRARCAAC